MELFAFHSTCKDATRVSAVWRVSARLGVVSDRLPSLQLCDTCSSVCTPHAHTTDNLSMLLNHNLRAYFRKCTVIGLHIFPPSSTYVAAHTVSVLRTSWALRLGTLAPEAALLDPREASQNTA